MEAREILGACFQGFLGPIVDGEADPTRVAINSHVRESVKTHIHEEPGVADKSVLQFAMREVLHDYTQAAHKDDRWMNDLELVQVLYYHTMRSPLVTEEWSATIMRAVGF